MIRMAQLALAPLGIPTQEQVRRVIEAVKKNAASPFFGERRTNNVDGPAPTFSRDRLWYVLTGCLLTTRQRSTRGSPVDRFMHKEPFPLALSRMEPGRVSVLVLSEIEQFHGIRLGPTIANRAEANFQTLSCEGWLAAETNYKSLLEQRKRTPVPSDKTAERAAAHWVSGPRKTDTGRR